MYKSINVAGLNIAPDVIVRVMRRLELKLETPCVSVSTTVKDGDGVFDELKDITLSNLLDISTEVEILECKVSFGKRCLVHLLRIGPGTMINVHSEDKETIMMVIDILDRGGWQDTST